jgi:hypothetical protein
MKRIFAFALVLCLLLAGCGVQNTQTSGDLAEAVAGDYYIDLTDLGMKLTIYLRIAEEGNFLFSSTPDFSVNKSDGTMQKVENEYLMVYTSVNGEAKSISDGLNSKFIVQEDGSLDFTVCERIYYGTASATTTSTDYPDAKLIAYPIPADYTAPSDESVFTAGTYTGTAGSAQITMSFFEDGTYLLLRTDGWQVLSETGHYGVSTTQLALTPAGGNRVSCDVLSDTELFVRVPAKGEEREEITVQKTESGATIWKTFSASDASMTLYMDGSFRVTAGGFEEAGVMTLETAQGTYKIYPDHPSSGARGLSFVASVPVGTLTVSAGKWTLAEFRVRTSENLSRKKITLTEQ